MPAAKHALLEICTASLEDVLMAESAGADRVELNSALLTGGLTPSAGCVQLVLEQTRLPVVAMARPRESGFNYSDSDFATLLRDIQWLVAAGVQGIAFGVLDSGGCVDRQRCQQVLRAIGPECQAVFHRAFDLVDQPLDGLEILIDCGVSRVMTSGGQPTAMQGQSTIARLVECAAGRIEILPAGGIRSDNVRELIATTGVDQVHAGPANWMVDHSYQADSQVNFYSPPPTNAAQYRCSDSRGIRDLVAALGQ